MTIRRLLRKHFPYFIGVYLLLHFLTRLFFTSGLEIDEAEQLFLTQKILLGYSQQPPLYTWITWVFVKIFGTNLLGATGLRYFLYFGIFVLVYKLSFAIFKKKEYASLCALSLILFPQFAIEGLRHTHTILVTFAVILMLFSFYKLTQKKSGLNYLFFGISIAIGFLSKYNFLISCLALGTAALIDKEYRAILLNPKIIISILASILLCSPHLLWLKTHFLTSKTETIGDLATQSTPYYISIWKSVGILLLKIPSFCVVYILMYFLLLKKEWRLIYKDSRSRFINLVKNFILFSFLILSLILIITKASHLHERWLQPILFIVPVFIFGLIDTYFQKKPLQISKIQKILVSIFAVVLLYKIVGFTAGPLLGFTERIHRPYKEAAYFFKKYNPNLILSETFQIAGCLKLHMPDTPSSLANEKLYDGMGIKNSISKNDTLLVVGHQKDYPHKMIASLKEKYTIQVMENSEKVLPFHYSKNKTFPFYYSILLVIELQ